MAVVVDVYVDVCVHVNVYVDVDVDVPFFLCSCMYMGMLCF